MRSSRSVFLCALALSACSANNDGVDSGRRDGSADSRADGRSDAPPTDVTDPNARQVETILIDPTDPVITVDPSVSAHPTQMFTVTGRRHDGTMTDALTGLWSLVPSGAGGVDPNLIGSIDPSTGLFTASGSAGGEIRVQVAVVSGSGTLMATTSLTVNVRATLYVGGAPMDSATHFAGTPMTDAAHQADVVYPLNHAVMPQNVYPADIQWMNGAAGDVFRVTLHKSHVTVIAYVLAGASFTNDYLVDASAWHQLAQTDVSEDLVINVDRFEPGSGQLTGSPPVNMRFANGSTAGTIYYWDIVAGRAIRIDDGTATRSTPIPTPPTSPDDASNCLGCHAVSRDGRYFAGRLGGGGNNRGVVFDLTTDLSATPAPTLYTNNDTDRWSYASFSPTSTRLVTDNYSTTTAPMLRVIDPMTGAVITPNIGTGTQPSWSPDGNTIAFVSGVTGWGGEFSSSGLSLLPVTGSDAYGAPHTIHTGSLLGMQPETGAADSYPSWSPDSHWLAFSHGNISRSDTGQGALYLISATTDGATPVRLDKANGGASTTDNFFPNFSPFDTGGYFWLSFLSRRDYGNTQAGTRTTGRQQIWVTAIRRMPDGTTDPSEVGYWLPGQDTASRNISAFWAPRPCRHDTEACTVNADCCSGICRDDGTGHNTCQPPPMDQCRMAYQPCGGGGCCMGLVCINNICSPPPG